jgi:hypothetical protein
MNLRVRCTSLYASLVVRVPHNVQCIRSHVIGCVLQTNQCRRINHCVQRSRMLSRNVALISAAKNTLRVLAPRLVCNSPSCSDGVEKLDFPGGSIPLTSQLHFIEGQVASNSKIPCYRTLDATGNDLPDAAVPHPVDQPLAQQLYTVMARLQVMDTLFYEAQRQVRASWCC